MYYKVKYQFYNYVVIYLLQINKFKLIIVYGVLRVPM